jgi:hypothetical protein
MVSVLVWERVLVKAEGRVEGMAWATAERKVSVTASTMVLEKA